MARPFPHPEPRRSSCTFAENNTPPKTEDHEPTSREPFPYSGTDASPRRRKPADNAFARSTGAGRGPPRRKIPLTAGAVLPDCLASVSAATSQGNTLPKFPRCSCYCRCLPACCCCCCIGVSAHPYWEALVRLHLAVGNCKKIKRFRSVVSTAF